MTVAFPAATPVIIPVTGVMVATEVLPLVQVPPPVTSESAVVFPIQTFKVPAMGTGPDDTVMVFVAMQPDGKV